MRIWQTVRRYIWWTDERGSFHYDVMVTLILLFIFVSPRIINFRDRPVDRKPRRGEVMVQPDGGMLRMLINAKGLPPQSEPQELRAALMETIEPIAGDVILDHYELVRDANGNADEYRVWVRR